MSGPRFEDVWMDWDGMGLDGPRSTHRRFEGCLREGSAHGSLHICIVLSSLWWLPNAFRVVVLNLFFTMSRYFTTLSRHRFQGQTWLKCDYCFHCSIMLQLLTLLPHYFQPQAHAAVFRTCKICFRSFVNAGRSDKPLGTGNSDNHFTYELKHSTTFCIPLVSAKPKGRSKSSLHNLDNCPKNIEQHTRAARNSFKARTEIAAARFELQSPEVLICLDVCQLPEVSIEKNLIWEWKIWQSCKGNNLLEPSPDESVVPGRGVRNSHVQVCKAPQWESASRST